MATVTKVTVHLGRKIPQPQLGPYHMVDLNSTWEATLAEGDDPMAVELELRQMMAETQRTVAMPFLKAAGAMKQQQEGDHD